MASKDEPRVRRAGVKLDRATGKMMGYVRVGGEGGLHSVEVDGEVDPRTVVGGSIVVSSRVGILVALVHERDGC